MKYKFASLITILITVVIQVFPQTIELDFPKLSGDTAWIYSFSGSRVDSLSVTLDTKGKAIVVFPQQEYRGMAYLYFPQKGGGEFIIAEKSLRITCPETQFRAEMLEFPQSEENSFLRWGFQWRNYLMQQKEWLEASPVSPSPQKWEGTSSLLEELSKASFSSSEGILRNMLEENKKAIQKLDDAIKNSPLYSARLIGLIGFMQRLYLATQSPDPNMKRTLIDEMENKVDINALFHSGNLWTDVHSYYLNLFSGENGDSLQTAYAASISSVMRRLEEPVLTAFLSTALTVCERANRQIAQEVMLFNFITMYPTLPISDPKVKRMLGALSLNKGSQAPPIDGISNPVTQPVILIFFESDCDHCVHELDWLIENYKEITAKGYRIISIAADMQRNNYQNLSSVFPWDKADRICDFKGMEGQNFKNYGIIGTPTIFIVDKKGMIIGKYAKMEETRILSE